MDHRRRSRGSAVQATASLALIAVLVLSGCARPGSYAFDDGAVPYDGTDPAAQASVGRFAPRRFYPPPGPASDPWGPYVQEAAARYSIPGQWIRAVMRQESGGREQAVSPVGAMGLMQVMPATYEGLRARHRLGDDPYDPHNNILAGAAYIREMFDRYGSPGFLAAYNAGPDRLDRYLAGQTSLPDETVNYLAAITPNLGDAVPLSGPLATYASAGGASVPPVPTVSTLASGCDVNAAFDPERPCTPLEQAASAPATVALAAAVPSGGAALGCDADAAFDPDRPCHPAAMLPPRAAPQPVVSQSLLGQFPARDARQEPVGRWGVQVGAFNSPGLARVVAEGARAEAPDQLRAASIATPPVPAQGGATLFRARLMSLSAMGAASACDQLNRRQLPCVVVQPAG